MSFLEEAAISKLINHYANLNDQSQWRELSNLYIEDGRFYRPTHSTTPIQGREAIYASLVSRPPRTTRHVVSNIVIDLISETRAKASSVILLYAGPVSEDKELPKLNSGMPLIGTFEDEFQKNSEGWKFVERRGRLSFAKE